MSGIETDLREQLVRAILQFDASDDYHHSDYEEPGYYAAIDRVVRLLRGEITDWQSPRGEEKP